MHSVELSDELHAAGVRNFKKQARMHLHKGDSGTVLPDIVDGLTKPALTWLDAHSSAKVIAHGPEETPILAELNAVFGRCTSPHVILIDDVRDFEDKSTYLALDDARKIAEANEYNYDCRFDLIRLTPRSAEPL